ncbi:MAG: hypothetical protein ACREFC_10725, partial [Stellaceae bacterium]
AEARDTIGHRLADLAASSAALPCIGDFDGVSTDGVGGGAKVSGWAWLNHDARSPDLVVLVDKTGTVIGMATVWKVRPDLAGLHPETAQAAIGWQGYSRPGQGVSAYVLSRTRRAACKLNGTFDLSAATP